MASLIHSMYTSRELEAKLRKVGAALVPSVSMRESGFMGRDDTLRLMMDSRLRPANRLGRNRGGFITARVSPFGPADGQV